VAQSKLITAFLGHAEPLYKILLKLVGNFLSNPSDPKM